MPTGAMSDAVTLPKDVDGCHELIKTLIQLVAKKDMDMCLMRERLQLLLREKFGKSSEKLSPDQLSLFAAELLELLRKKEETLTDAGENKPEKSPSQGTKHGGGGRNPLPPALPRQRKDYHPSQAELLCSCGQTKEEFANDVVEQLDYVPASFKVIQHVVHKYRCKGCGNGVVEGKRPEQIHSGGSPSEGLIAQISTAKYSEHQPLDRQEQAYAREGVQVASSSMGRWLEMSANVLQKITDRMHLLLLQSPVIQADESPFDLIDKSRHHKKVKKGYVWVLYGELHPYTFYKFESSRSADTAKALLAGFNGFLLTDGYGGYTWYQARKSANCNVHARRYFEKALAYDKEKCRLILALFTNLYRVEGELKGSAPEKILEVRQQQSAAIMNQIKVLLQQWQPDVPAKTTLGIAINYTLGRWDQLVKFLSHPELRPDTNLVENAIRPIAIGRRNWMKIGGEGGLKTASVHATLINTCKRLGINPYLYLRDVLIRLGEGEGETGLDDLLPDRWKLKHDPTIQDATVDHAASSVARVA